MPKIMPLTTAWLISHAGFVGWVGFGSSSLSQFLPGQVPTFICAAEGGFGHPEKPLIVGQVVNHGPMGQPHWIYGCKMLNEICECCDREAKEKLFTTLESERHANRGLNRYRDVNPYDHSRIVLKRGSVDYINANLVQLERAERQYILTQGPLVDTVGHFWLMVWEQKSRGILMLNKLMEKKQIKCHLYWPNEMGADKALKLPNVKLTVELIRCETYQNFVRRWFKLTDLETQQSREVMQFHYTTWPDFGIPSSPNAFLKFLQQVRDSDCLSRDVGPAVVHCSAGIGRSGTFCLVDCCLVLIDKYGECNVSKVLCELRSYRMGLIQTADQLDFSYQAIIEGITKLHDPEIALIFDLSRR
ncbi:tyrosine-protein phosphatase non-receptor type 61F isoform X5 [Drosophila subpulchrella]|uniref:tyrosine-protein phosphatase non-receptor type 61F isoform X5 n=1 Tax=Drosophila subpulchrella TaxID=1486046 RepID=UPI0018A15928|nr:tyrosine-protein phosphatase non-receptor type 61F isoform X5 [Drosophila subpulchrella]